MKLPAHVLFRKELSLMVWKPHGILDQALVKAIVAFVEKVTKGGSPDFVPPNERKIGTFSDALMAEAKKISWTVIGMKNDWKKIYAFEP